MSRLLLSLCLLLMITLNAPARTIVDFEELTTFSGENPAGGGSFYNGNDGSGTSNSDGWTSHEVHFNNNYNGESLPAFDFWEGWAYSNVVNATTPGFTNQYASIAGGGSDGNGQAVAGEKYAVAFGTGSYFDLPENSFLASIDVTNTAYAALSMTDGDNFTKKFGGPTGDEPDLFQVTFIGYDAEGATGNLLGEVIVDLADYRFEDNTRDYVLDDWLTVDLSRIATARSVGLSFASTDTGDFGINTPAYVAVDNVQFTIVPEPSGFVLLWLALAGANAYICRRSWSRMVAMRFLGMDP